MSRFDQIFIADRLGAEAAAAPAPDPAAGQVASAGIQAGAGIAQAAMGGGGGGMGASISIDPAAIIGSITQAVESGKAVENNPTVYFRELNNKLRKRLGDVKRLNDQLANKNRFLKRKKDAIAALKAAGTQQRRNLRNWLRDPNKKFKSGPLRGKYKDPLGAQIRRNERRYIGRHKVKSIDKPRLDFNKAEIRRVNREAQRNWSHRKRTDLLKHWQDALNIETMKPMLSGKPEGMALMQMASTGFALTPTNLKIVFPDKRQYPHVDELTSVVEANEAHRGIVPATFRNPAATSLINLFSNGYVAGTDAAPNWLLGVPTRQSGGGISLNVTPVKDIFLAMHPDPADAAAALEARNNRLVQAGVIPGERDAGGVQAVSDVVTNIRQGQAGAATGTGMPGGVPYTEPAYEELPPAQPTQPAYDPYAQQGYYPQQGYYQQQGYQQQGYYPSQQGYYQQQGYYPQQQYPQSGYYPAQQPAMAGFHWRVPNVRR